jgi:hypothetical protein
VTADAADFRDLAFGELTGGAVVVELPLRFRVPAGFVAVREDGGLRTWWMSEADRAAWERGEPPRDGFFSVALGLNAGYDRARDVFFGGGEGEGDESTLAEEFAAAGFQDIAIGRHDVNGIPVLFVEGRREDRRIAMCYLATLVDTNVVFIFYSHPAPFRDLDGRRWAEIKRAVLSSGEALRTSP